jgi:hypothetical protein
MKEEAFVNCIKIAEDNGYEFLCIVRPGDGVSTCDTVMSKEEMLEEGLEDVIIFDRDFARALFGGGLFCPICKTAHEGKDAQCNATVETAIGMWENHLQKLAISEDRIQYLDDYLKSIK